MIWFTSDLHLGHEGVIRYCDRPFMDVKEMDDILVTRWNHTVKDADTVYCLGDISFHKPAVGVPLLQKLRGKKILIQGNHDKYSATQYQSAGFTVFQEASIRLSGWHVRMSHYPYWEDDPNQDKRYQDRRPHNKGGWLLCGHVHEKWKVRGRQINVGVDKWDFSPVSQSVIESILMRETPQR